MCISLIFSEGNNDLLASVSGARCCLKLQK